MFDTESRDLLNLGRHFALKQRYDDALKSFQRALHFLARDGDLILHPQYLSHYGLSLAAAGRKEEGRRFCERSIQLEPYEPEHYLNLGLIHEMFEDPSAAFWAFDRGLSVCPDHPALLDHKDRIERRRSILFRRLPRSHPLNRYLGKLLSVTGIQGG